MSLYQDRQIKGFLIFLILFSLLFVGTGAVLTIYQVNDVEVLWLKHDEAVSSSLLEQGVSKEVIAVAFTNTNISENGRSLLTAAGLGKQAESSMRPFFNQFQRSAFFIMLCTVLFFLFVLTIGVFVFFLEKEAIVPTGRQNIIKLHQRGLLFSFATELRGCNLSSVFFDRTACNYAPIQKRNRA